MFIFLFVLFLVVVLFIKGIIVVRQAEAVIVERLGKFHRVLGSGLHFIVPVFDTIRIFRLDGRYRKRIDLRELVMDFPPQPVITHDNVTMQVDSVIYYQISDPGKASYEIEDLSLAIRQLAITNLRNVMGEMDLDETLTSRERVNTKLRIVLDEATDKWGVKVTRVELKNISPPHEIEEAMAKQMKAERERRATVTEAEGIKRSQILRAEGERDSAVANAEGDKQATILRAEAEAAAIEKVAIANADAIRVVFKGIHDGRPTKGLIAIKYLEALEKIADAKSAKVFIPYEATGILGAVASIGEILKEKNASSEE
ncbi:MAG: SPFH/Band 7/PHB domain protein [Myxococcales bacterium]|nr:MAG: SPFH/Band 7/PHB domain protein [Myxococcales bacterium]